MKKEKMQTKDRKFTEEEATVLQTISAEELEKITGGISIDPICLAECMIVKFDLVRCNMQCTKF